MFDGMISSNPYFSSLAFYLKHSEQGYAVLKGSAAVAAAPLWTQRLQGHT
jgi:hypothetical protein